MAYIDKKYGKVWGDTMRFVKTVNDVKNTGKDLAKNTKQWKKAGIQGDPKWMSTHYKGTLSNVKKLVKSTAKVGEFGYKGTT